jgi:hypothetical protein
MSGGACLQFAELLYDLVFTRLGNACGHRIAVRVGIAGEVIKARVTIPRLVSRPLDRPDRDTLGTPVNGLAELRAAVTKCR